MTGSKEKARRDETGASHRSSQDNQESSRVDEVSLSKDEGVMYKKTVFTRLPEEL
jgi:hypothetical protein